MQKSGIKSKCRKCGKDMPVEDFVLDYVYKMMVCSNCSRERRAREGVKAELKDKKKEKAEEKPAGWDMEDAYLEKAHKMKIGNSVKVERVDDDRVKYTCPKCSYEFLYNIVRKTPGRCPYCSNDIMRINL